MYNTCLGCGADYLLTLTVERHFEGRRLGEGAKLFQSDIDDFEKGLKALRDEIGRLEHELEKQ
jgi:hypothetical protein